MKYLGVKKKQKQFWKQEIQLYTIIYNTWLYIIVTKKVNDHLIPRFGPLWTIRFFFILCKEIVYLSTMVIGAVRSHSLLKTYQSQTTLKSVTDLCNWFAPGEAFNSSTSSLYSVMHTIYSANILWALEIVKCNFSKRSYNNKFQLFQRMFPDSVSSIA